MVTSRDIARLANVSQSSVSRALRGDPQISGATRERIQRIAAENGYVPSDAGRSLATGMTGRVGIVVGDISSPYYAELISRLHVELARAGYAAMIFVVEGQGATSQEVDSVRLILGRSVDGVIMLTNHNIPEAIGSGAATFPTIWVNSDSPDAQGDWCVIDNETTGRIVAREFLDLGHTEIGMIFPLDPSPTSQQRERAFRMELRKSGVTVSKQHVHRGRTGYETGYEGFLELIGQQTPPTAIFCYTDLVALGALNAARAAGVSIPDAVSVIGVGNIPVGGWELVQLTSVSYDLNSLVHWAVALLQDRITSDRPLPHRRMLFEPTLIRRSSHGPVAESSTPKA